MTQSEQIQKLMTENMFLKQQNRHMLAALKEAEAALHMLGGKKKPPTGFIPCEVAAYRIVSKVIELVQTKANLTDE